MNKLITTTLVIILMLISCGEKERIVEIPVNCKPSPPDGVTVINLDGSVRICWYPNFEPEEDIVFYDLYKAVKYDTTYAYIGTVDAESPDPYEYCFDYETDNGVQFYYAVVAVDEGGRESELSLEEVTGTPRPQDEITLREHRLFPMQSGYDFSDLTNVPQMDSLQSTDVYFGVDSAGASFIAYRSGVDIQDYGFVEGFDVVSRAPDKGWSPSRRTEAIAGHCYILRLLEEDAHYHYVKIYVTEVTTDYVTFRWAYQIAPDNRDLISLSDGDGGGRGIVKLTGDAGSRDGVKRRKRLM